MKKWLQTFLLAANLAFLQLPAHAQIAPFSCDPCCCIAFDGLYVGVNGGFLSYSSDKTDAAFIYGNLATYSAHDSSWEAGLQLGYDWRWCHKVFGLVGDFNWTHAQPSLRLDTAFAAGGTPADAGQLIEGKMNWFSTARVRFGLTLRDTLFYLTTGAAVVKIQSRITNALAEIPELTNKRSRWGWTVGFGSEFAFCRRLSLFGEVLYTTLKPYKVTFSVSDNSCKFHDEFWTGRIGLNYHFSLCSLCGR